MWEASRQALGPLLDLLPPASLLFPLGLRSKHIPRVFVLPWPVQPFAPSCCLGLGLPPCPQLLPGSLLPRRLCPENGLPQGAAGLPAGPSGCFCPFEAPCLEEEERPASKSGSHALGREGRPSLCLPPPGQVLLVEEGPGASVLSRKLKVARSSGEGAGLYVKTECHSAPEETASTAPRVPQRLDVEWLSARRGGSGSAQAPWSGLALPF